MEDRLKTFISEHTNELDVHEPPDLWGKISSQLPSSPAVRSSGKGLTKGLFLGITAVIIGAASCYYLIQPTPSVSSFSSQEKTGNDLAEPETEGTASLPLTMEVTEAVKEQKEPAEVVKAQPVSDYVNTEVTQEVIPAAVAGSAISPLSPVLNAAHDTLRDIADSLFNGIKTVEIEGEFFDVYVKTHTAGTVLFHKESHITAKGLHSKIPVYKVITDKRDSVLRIRIDCDGKKGIVMMGSLVIAATMDLTVPEGTALRITNVSGNVRLNGLKGPEQNIITSSGDISIQNIRSNINLKSVSGDIKSVNCTGNLKAVTSSGNQFIEKAKGNIVTQSVAGDLKISEIKGNISATSSSGNQVVRAVIGNIECNAVSGDLKLNDCKGELFAKTSSGDIIGKNIDLLKKAILECVSGDIRIDFSNDNNLSYDLSTISGDLSVDNGKVVIREEKRLLYNQGSIQVSGRTSSGNQIFK